MDWRAFYHEHRTRLEENYPGLTLERFLREADEIQCDPKLFLEGVPFAYLLGYAEFAGLPFKVTPDTLIPRPETEQLFELVSNHLSKHTSWKRLLDVGTGSGCLGITLKKTHPKLDVTLSDLSPLALSIAETNAFNLSVPVKTVESDLLTSVVGLFDVIVSNPPYIPKGHSGVHSMTHKYEPHLALYVNESDYASFFKRLFSQVVRHLTADGMFFMEGYEEKLLECAEWARAAKLTNVTILPDLSGMNRFLVASASRAPIG